MIKYRRCGTQINGAALTGSQWCVIATTQSIKTRRIVTARQSVAMGCRVTVKAAGLPKKSAYFKFCMVFLQSDKLEIL